MKLKNKLTFILLITTFFISISAVKADYEKYDKVLARLEKIKAIETSELEGEKNKKENTPVEKWVLTFDNDKLMQLNGTWVFRKKVKKRADTVLRKSFTQVSCNHRIPFAQRPFEKDVVISAQGVDQFAVRAIYPATYDTHYDLTKTQSVQYQNFGLKGIITEDGFSYTYTTKIVNNSENPAFLRQMLFKGNLKTEKITPRKITGKGYEVEYSPECIGSVRDEVEFELVRKDVKEDKQEKEKQDQEEIIIVEKR